MLAPPRPTARGPVFRRALTRTSLVGVGLVALSTAGLPAAVATDDEDVDTTGAASEETLEDAGDAVLLEDGQDDDLPGDAVDELPAASLSGFFGRGKSVAFHVGYEQGSAPDGLDLSGAVFTVAAGTTTFSCTTNASGACSVGNGNVAAGTYAVTQTAGPEGLAPAGGAGSVEICPPLNPFDSSTWCNVDDPFELVLNDSLFSSPVLGSVRNSVTGDPIEGAAYTLSGSGYYGPRPEDEPEDGSDEDSDEDSEATSSRVDLDDEGTSDEKTDDGDADAVPGIGAVSAVDGTLTFRGWFLPGDDYVLTPGTGVEGFEADTETRDIEIDGPGRGRAAALTPRLLDPIGIVDPEGPGPLTPVTPSPTPTPAPVNAPVPAPAGGAASGRGATGGQAVTPGAAAESSAAPAPTSAPATRSSSAGRTTAPSSPPVVRLADEPELSTVSSNLPDRGVVIALGIAFLVVVLVGLALVRRHARSRG